MFDRYMRCSTVHMRHRGVFDRYMMCSTLHMRHREVFDRDRCSTDTRGVRQIHDVFGGSQEVFDIYMSCATVRQITT